MTSTKLRELLVGPVAPVATPFDDGYEVDYGKMHELAQWWVENGIIKGKAVIKVAAAIGEGPMLSDNEWPHLLRTVVKAVDGKATILCGLHYKDTKRTIEDAKRAQDLGAMALQVCPPIFNLPSQRDILDYFGELSAAIDIGIVVYHTHWLEGGRIDTDTFLQMSDFENVVAIKWSPHGGQNYQEMAKFVGRFNVIDNTVDPVRCHQLGGHGFVQTTIEAYPAHDLSVSDLMQQKKYVEAELLYRSVMGPFVKFQQKISMRSGGQARAMKGLQAVLGRPIGWSRLPSQPLDDAELTELRELVRGFGWPVKG